jgi:hypothetical protein
MQPDTGRSVAGRDERQSAAQQDPDEDQKKSDGQSPAAPPTSWRRNRGRLGDRRWHVRRERIRLWAPAGTRGSVFAKPTSKGARWYTEAARRRVDWLATGAELPDGLIAQLWGPLAHRRVIPHVDVWQAGAREARHHLMPAGTGQRTARRATSWNGAVSCPHRDYQSGGPAWARTGHARGASRDRRLTCTGHRALERQRESRRDRRRVRVHGQGYFKRQNVGLQTEGRRFEPCRPIRRWPRPVKWCTRVTVGRPRCFRVMRLG